jgi:ribosomal protein L17
MRHRKSGRKLGRTSSHRKAMFRNMVTSLLRHEQIRTTVPKAKELRQHVEPIITLARKHAWSNYEGLFTDLNNTLASLDFKSLTADEQSALKFVKDSAASVTARFPSGLGRLFGILHGNDGFKDEAILVLRIREAQMARQHAISQAKSTVSEVDVLEKLFGELAETFKERNGGYTRVTKDGHREGDNADMAYISLVLEPLSASDPVDNVEEPVSESSEAISE